MGVKQDILKAARGEMPDRVPWTIYSNLQPQGETERQLRSKGLALIHPVQIHPIQSFSHPNVEVVHSNETVDGVRARRVTYRTPVGEVTEVRRSHYASGMAGYVADWRLEYMVKQPADYEVVEFIVRDQVFGVDYDAIRQTQREIGDDGVAIVRVNRAPQYGPCRQSTVGRAPDADHDRERSRSVAGHCGFTDRAGAVRRCHHC